MTDLRKAAEMALEALEWNYGTDLENIENCTAWLDKMNAIIPALRQALDDKPLVKTYAGGKPNYCTPKHELDLEAPLTVNGVPLYPKKEWVGLTDDEIVDLVFSVDSYKGLVQATEAKLKEKNGG